MQKGFEFDAPRYCCLTIPPNKRNSQDYRLDQTDSSDFWFMHSHVPPEPFQNINKDDAIVNLQIPVVRRSIRNQIQPQNQPIQPQQQHINRPNIIQPPREQDNHQKQKNNTKKQVKRQVKKPIARQSSKIIPKKTQNTRENKSNDTRAISAQKKNKPLIKNQIVTRSQSFQAKTNIKQIRPCPYPPRIQRQWQEQYKKRWYSLSPNSKIEAEQQMEKIQQKNINKQKKSQIGNNDKLKANPLRFRF